MSDVFQMPEVGEGVVEVEIAMWKVAVGDVVARDQVLCEVTTDKASLEITSPRAGTVAVLHAQPGEILKVHTPLVTFGGEASASAPSPAPSPAAGAAPVPSAAVASTPSAPAGLASPSASSSPVLGEGPARAAPAVRRHAHEVGVDLRGVAGSGRDGRITRADIDAAARGGPPASAVTVPAPLPIAPVALPQVASASADQRIPITGVRRKIAERMVAAKHTAPHFTYVEEIDASALVSLRTRLKPRAERQGVSLTYMPFFAKACSIAFRDFPNVNAVMDEAASELVVRAEHHLGFACDTPTGLMVPVIRNVERKSILQIAAEMQDLFARTRAGKAKREELSGSTFTVTSVGSIGGVLATPILNVPEVAILGVNAIRQRAVVADDGSIVARPMTYLSPSFDHRVLDGAVAARFIARLKDLLETPEQLLLELV
jgi:pyruvate dehydrogenase E2 component (dihydrolipoamide acetyltransferase)